MSGAGRADGGRGRRLARAVVDPVAARLAAPVDRRLDGLEARLASVEARLVEVRAAVDGARAEMSEVMRLLGQQGDAVVEAAELTGRILARLGAEVEALTGELAGRRGGGAPDAG